MRRRAGRFKKTGVRKVNVPNLSGLTRSQAQTALSAVGLTYSESTTSTSDSGLTNYIQSQNKSSGETVLIGSSVTFVYYNYVAPPVTPPVTPPVSPPASDCTDDDAGFCSGCAFYQYQYSPSGQFSCSPRLLCANGCWLYCGTAYSGC